MIIEFADPGYNWVFITWTGIVLIALLVTAITLNIVWAAKGFPGEFESPLNGLVGLFYGLTVFWALIPFLFAGVMTGDTDYQERVDAAIVASLEDTGFEQIDLSGLDFTADKDGEYFRGTLDRYDTESDYAYQVLELVPR